MTNQKIILKPNLAKISEYCKTKKENPQNIVLKIARETYVFWIKEPIALTKYALNNLYL